jgi:hypothetical protein
MDDVKKSSLIEAGLSEDGDAQEREMVMQFEAISALFMEALRQNSERRKKLRRQIEDDPTMLLRELQVLKVANDCVTDMEKRACSGLQQRLKRAADISTEADAEIDPEIKSRLLEMLDRHPVASLTEKIREMEMAGQRRSELVESLASEINELITSPLPMPSKQKDPE